MLCCCKRTPKSAPSFESPVVKFTVASDEPAYDRNNPPLGAILTGAKKLHAKGFTGLSIRVGVIDSGVDKDHPGFSGRVKKQVWYRKGSPLSEDDHGTHVAGTIHFMAPDAEIYDYRVFGSTGVSVDVAIAKAIAQAVEDGCHLINMSLGSPVPNARIHSAIKQATAKGVLCICAAGNSGDGNALTNEPHFPAQYEECISVAAVSKKDGLPVARFSSSNQGVDHAGIGVGVISFKPDGGFQGMSGTSMACPHVCGFVAAILSQDKSADIRKRLADEFSIDIGIPGPDKSTGLGFVSSLTKSELNSVFDTLDDEIAGPQASVY